MASEGPDKQSSVLRNPESNGSSSLARPFENPPDSFEWNAAPPSSGVVTSPGATGKPVRVQDSPLFDRKDMAPPSPETPWQQEEPVKQRNASESMLSSTATTTHHESPSFVQQTQRDSPLQESYQSLPSSLHSSRSPSTRRDFSPTLTHKRHSAPSPRSFADMSLNPDKIHVTVLPERQGLIFKHTKYHIQCPQVSRALMGNTLHLINNPRHAPGKTESTNSSQETLLGLSMAP